MDALIKLGGKTNGLFADKLYAWYDKYYVGVKHYFPINLINNDQKRYEDAKLAQMAGTYTNDTDALTQSLGDLYSAETAWIKKRIQYMMSKYSYGEYSANGTDSIHGRAAGNEIRYTITPAIDLYPNIASGTSIIRGDRTYAGEPCEIVIDLQGSADQQNIIQGASYLMDIGKWYDKYIDGNMIIKGRMLRNIELGSKTEPITIAISSLTISNTPVLKTLDVSNISTLSGSLDLGSCTGIENIYAYGTSLSQIKLPDGGVVRNIEFPESTAYLTLKNFPLIEANGVGIDLCKENITDFFVTGCDKLNSLNLLETILIAQEEQSEHNLKRIRAIGFDSTYNGSEGTLAMDRLSKLADGSYVGLDSNGLAGDDVPIPVLEGSITLNCNAYKDAIDVLSSTYPKIDFTMLGDYFIRFADSAVLSICATKWGDATGNTLTDKQASEVTQGSFYQTFKGNTSITSFDEFQYFTKLTYFPDSGFSGCTNLRSITMSENINEVGARGAENCSNLEYINLHTGITKINYNAFNECRKLALDINLPNLTSLGYNSFRYTDITKISNLGVITSISDDTFFGCKNLKSIVIPDTVTSIGNYAFGNTNSLDGLIDGKNVTTLSGYAFGRSMQFDSSEVQGTIDISFPNLTTLSGINHFRFSNVRNVLDLGNVTIIPDYAFAQCNKLETVNLPINGVKLNASAFSTSPNLKNIDFSRIKSLGANAFYGCKALPKTLRLTGLEGMQGGSAVFSGAGIERIEDMGQCTGIICTNASNTSMFFAGAESLRYVRFPATLQTLRYNSPNGAGTVFQWNSQIHTIIFEGTTPPEWCTLCPSNNSVYKVYVPDEALDIYKTATGWVGIASRIYPISELPVE